MVVRHLMFSFLFRPIQAFHDTHVAAQITRLSCQQYKKHQIQSKSVFARLKPSDRLLVGDRVLLLAKKKIIRKDSSVFNPRYEETPYTIQHIDKTSFPFLYQLKDYPKPGRR